jgi:hypothetical protein
VEYADNMQISPVARWVGIPAQEMRLDKVLVYDIGKLTQICRIAQSATDIPESRLGPHVGQAAMTKIHCKRKIIRVDNIGV